jgi:hypothetical protein
MGIHHCSEEICKVHERPKEDRVDKHMRLGNILNHVSIPEELLRFDTPNYIKLDNCNIGLSNQPSKPLQLQLI